MSRSFVCSLVPMAVLLVACGEMSPREEGLGRGLGQIGAGDILVGTPPPASGDTSFVWNAFISKPAKERWEDDGGWRQEYGSLWNRGEPMPPALYDVMESGEERSCAEIELLCRFAAYHWTLHDRDGDGDDDAASFCDFHCTALGLQCAADRLKNRVFSLVGECADPTGAECATGKRNWQKNATDLINATITHYRAAALFMHGAESGEGPVCMHHFEESLAGHRREEGDGPAVVVVDNELNERYASKIIYSLDELESLGLETARRLLARGDAGYGRNTPASSAQEWYGNRAPRSLALQSILGGGLQLHPCVVDPTIPGFDAARELFSSPAVRRNPNPGFCDLYEFYHLGDIGLWADECRRAVLDYLDTSEGAWEAVLRSEAERLKIYRTSGSPTFPEKTSAGLRDGFPEFTSTPAISAVKRFVLWRADGAAASEAFPVSNTGAQCLFVHAAGAYLSRGSSATWPATVRSEWESYVLSPDQDPPLDTFSWPAFCFMRPFATALEEPGTLEGYVGSLHLVDALAGLWSRLAVGPAFPAVEQTMARIANEERFSVALTEPGPEAGDIYSLQIEVRAYGDLVTQAGYGNGVDTYFDRARVGSLLRLVPRDRYVEAAVGATLGTAVLSCQSTEDPAVNAVVGCPVSPGGVLQESCYAAFDSLPSDPTDGFPIQCGMVTETKWYCSAPAHGVSGYCGLTGFDYPGTSVPGAVVPAWHETDSGDPPYCTSGAGSERLKCRFGAVFTQDLADPDLVPLLADHPLSDYTGTLSSAGGWGMAGDLGAVPAAGSFRHGIWLLMLGNTPIGWVNTWQLAAGLIRLTGDAPIDPGPPLSKLEPVVYHHGNRLLDLAQQITERNPDDCRFVARNSLGLSQDLVPPLENEATLDQIPYESAHQRYLQSAHLAADEAVGLMADAQAAEHQMLTDRERYLFAIEESAEEADQAVIRLCGDIDPTSATDASLVRSFCHVPMTAFAPELGDAETDVRYRWWKSFAAGLADAPFDPINGNRPGIEGNCAVYKAYFDSRPSDFALWITLSKAVIACQAYEVLRLSTDRLESATAVPPQGVVQIPEVLTDGLLSGPDMHWQGEVRNTLGNIDSSMGLIASSYADLGIRIQELSAALDKMDTEYSMTIDAMNSDIRNAVSDAMVETTSLAVEVSTWAATNNQTAADGDKVKKKQAPRFDQYLTVEAVLEKKNIHFSLEDKKTEAYQITTNAILAMAAYADFMATAALQLDTAINQIRERGSDLEGLEEAAVAAADQADRDMALAKLQSISNDPWVRSNIASRKRRALESMKRAQKLAYVARKSIEFRFVVDLNEIDAPMLLGDVPAQWADDVFLDQFAVGDPLDAYMRPTLDYVTRLTDFLTFYSATYPFQNGSTTAIISLKDDIGTPFFSCCEEGIDCPGDETGVVLEDQPYEPNWFKKLCPEEPEESGDNGGAVFRARYDFHGDLMRGAFHRHCAGEAPEITHDVQYDCAEGSESFTDYYTRRFWLTLPAFGAGGRLAHLGLSDQNYNYRIRDLALNLVGSNVHQCDEVDSGSGCFSIAFVPYDLINTGTVRIRDHGGTTREYLLPRGGALGGKALAAERVITNPIFSNDLSLISQYWAQEFRGRPLQGEYELRLYATESFVWENLEDVQVVVQLDYWSPFEVLP